MMSEAEFDEISEQVGRLSYCGPESSIARKLLAELRAMRAANEEKETQDFIRKLRGTEHLTEDEAWLVFYGTKVKPIEFETGECRPCNGTGSVLGASHCVGFTTEQCPKCRGTRKGSRIKVPEAICNCHDGKGAEHFDAPDHNETCRLGSVADCLVHNYHAIQQRKKVG